MPQLVSHGPHETPGEGSCVSVSRRGFRTNNPKVVDLSTLLGDNDSRQKPVLGVPPAGQALPSQKKRPCRSETAVYSTHRDEPCPRPIEHTISPEEVRR